MQVSADIQSFKKRQWYYRGSLKSCNYGCSYCPFSKKRSSPQKLEEDRQQLFRFIRKLEEMKNVGGAVLVVPYGEAMIHKYYWEGLAELSRNHRIDAVGAQSNFSFPVDEMLKFYEAQGGDISKLRLWGTFHPEMTTVEAFISQCEALRKWKIAFSVGAVGVPEQISDIRKLRECLDSSVYVWINKMDGLGRNYTEPEIEAFLSIDEYFEMELKHHPADINLCKNSIFVEADGSVRRCNLSRQVVGNLYEDDILYENNILSKQMKLRCEKQGKEDRSDSYSGSSCFKKFDKKQVCSRKECSCYLAYNNRNEEELFFFQPYPAFRIPVYPRAVFFDVDGTLVPEGKRMISEETVRKVEALAKHCDIYLATSLPLEDAVRKTQNISHVIHGGIFANGARCVIRKKEYDVIYPIETSWLACVDEAKKKYGFQVHIYRKEKSVYKVTLSFPRGKFCRIESKKDFADRIIRELKIPDCCKWTVEENCIQIIDTDREKLKGILEISEVMGYQREEIMTVGNSDNDVPMLKYFPFSVAVKNSSKQAKKAAKVSL